MDHYRRSQLNCFTDASLDRVAPRRVDADWVDTLLKLSTTRLVPLWGSASLFRNDDVLAPLMLAPHELGDKFAEAEFLVLSELLDARLYRPGPDNRDHSR